MKKIIAAPLLMTATILIIVGFQVYWLKNSYDREKRLLEGKTGIVFRTTVFEMQAKKLDLGSAKWNTKNKKDINVVLKDDEGNTVHINKSANEQVVGISNVARRFRDSAAQNRNGKSEVIVSINNSSSVFEKDSLAAHLFTRPIGNGRDKIIQVLYGIDALQDTLKVGDIKKAVARSFKEEKLDIAFDIIRNDTAANKVEHIVPAQPPGEAGDKLNEVTVGFAKPVTYTLSLQNTSLYLFKKILSPFLFSVFLIGVTLISFFVLYRNLIRQRRLTEIKNEFIGNITHELKTPISTVSVAIEAIKNFNALQNPERTKEYLDIANNELQRLGLLVDKVLKLSMFEKQQLELKQEWFDLKQLAEEVMTSMRIQFEKHHADVKLITEGNDFTVMADRLHILSVIYNLLDNAIKYSKQNPAIEISILAKEENFMIKVKDDGIGIPAAYKEKIFDKFFRVPSGDRHNVKGYGLGLSYVAHIVQRHRGAIDVWSEEGKGTQFVIQLPKEHGKH